MITPPASLATTKREEPDKSEPKATFLGKSQRVTARWSDHFKPLFEIPPYSPMNLLFIGCTVALQEDVNVVVEFIESVPNLV